MSDLEPRPQPTPGVRISDADRERVAEILRTAAGDGRITLDELDHRLERAYAARTETELAPITADLPGQGSLSEARPGGRVVAGDRVQRVSAFMGGLERTGHWVVPELFNVRVVMGGGTIDLRTADFAAHEVVLNVRAVMGGVEVVVNPETRVIIEGTGVMGSFTAASSNVKPELTDDSPVVRVRGTALWGSVVVYRKRVKSDRPR